MRLPPSLLAGLSAAPGVASWPGVVASTPGVQASVERALGAASGDLGALLLDRLVSGNTNTWHAVRSALWTDSLARAAGARFIEAGEGPGLSYASSEGARITLAPLSFRTLDHLAGPPHIVRRVVAALETVLLPHRFAVYVREPMADEADSTGLVASAFGWIRDVERGRAARHVSFDDEEAGLHLDIDLIAPGDGSRPGVWFVVPPCRGPEWLGLIDRRLQQLLRVHDADVPIIPVLCAEPRWNLGRGFQCQWLYGAPTRVHVRPKGSARIDWSDEPTGFFADDDARCVSAMWWVERGDAGAMSSRGWSHVNPRASAPGIAFPGAHLADHSDGAGWAWSAPPPSVWEAP